MEISSFELIYKPQSPAGPADVVLQGYFLNIANLEDVDLFFRLDFVTSSVADPDRDLFDNTVAFIDTPNANNLDANLLGSAGSKSYRLSRNVTVPAHGTAKVAVLPSDPFVAKIVGKPDFESRGYVTLRLPPRFSFPPFAIGPQLDRPARVLLTPQNRAVYLSGYEGGKISISDLDVNAQTQAALLTGNGSAIGEVKPEKGFFQNFSVANALEELSASGKPLAPNFDENDFAMMLAMASASGTNLKKLNSGLKEAGIGITLQKREV